MISKRILIKCKVACKIDSFSKKIYKKKKNKCLKSIRVLDFEKVLEKETSQNIFVHAGLSKLKMIQGVEQPYIFLRDELKKYFNNIMAPGFSPSFRNSKIYSSIYNVPEYGNWSKLFFQDATQRTYDPLHSILVNGSFDFSSCNYRNSFGENSCFYELVKKNVLFADIGTDTFVCTLLHLIENNAKVPYIKNDYVSGEFYYNETHHERITQLNYGSEFDYIWNRKKIVKDLKNAGILRDYSFNGLTMYFFYSKDFYDFIMNKVIKNNFYLLKGM